MKRIEFKYHPNLYKYAQKSKKFISEKLIAKIPAEILNEQISDKLFERDYTIYD